MANDKEDGMQKLFRMPDLVEKLLPFLDASSTLCLAQSKISCVLQILQHRSAPWDKMVRRTLSGNFKTMWRLYSEGLWILDSEEHAHNVSESFQEKRAQLVSLVAVFKKMAGAKSDKLHHLLDVISEKSAQDCPLAPSIKISCSCHAPRSVSPLGFLLLEEVEASIGSTLQEIVWVLSPRTRYRALQEPLLSALASRGSRQQRKMERVEAWYIKITSEQSALALFTLVQNTHTVGFTPEEGDWMDGVWRLEVSGKMEADGWATIARALALIPQRVHSVIASKELMRAGTRSDLRTVWESLSHRWDVGNHEFYQKFFKLNGEASWNAFEQLLDNYEGEESPNPNVCFFGPG